MNLFRQVGLSTLTIALLLGACSTTEPTAIDSTDVTNLAFTDDDDAQNATSTTLINEAPDVSLAEGAEALVQFEAEWVCELQRRTFPTPDALNAALSEELTASGLDRADYDSFRNEVNNDQDLRDSILFAYQETCRP